MNKFPNNSGFTIIEVLVSVFVMSIIYVVATNFVINGLNIEKYVKIIDIEKDTYESCLDKIVETVARFNGRYFYEKNKTN